MYDDIVDYDDFSERVGSENDILDLIYDEIWKKMQKIQYPQQKQIRFKKYSLSSLQYTVVCPARDNIFQDTHRFS